MMLALVLRHEFSFDVPAGAMTNTVKCCSETSKPFLRSFQKSNSMFAKQWLENMHRGRTGIQGFDGFLQHVAKGLRPKDSEGMGEFFHTE